MLERRRSALQVTPANQAHDRSRGPGWQDSPPWTPCQMSPVRRRAEFYGHKRAAGRVRSAELARPRLGEVVSAQQSGPQVRAGELASAQSVVGRVVERQPVGHPPALELHWNVAGKDVACRLRALRIV